MFRNISKIAILSTLVALILTGCSYKYRSANMVDATSNSNLNKEYNKVIDARNHLDLADDMNKYVTSQTTLEATIASLSTQLMQNQKINTDKPVLITSFVRLDQLKETSEFGRVLGESLINDLSNRGFNVIEYRGQMAVSINEKGEYFISRKPHEIKSSAPNTYVVVGTYSRQAGKVILNARIIDNISGKIITSARSTYLHNLANDCTLFKDCPPARTINIVREK
ncbi:FlgO family outer membrane protein [Arcobacter vandammei]|uniref:FlgO family outer membrane protein n=1 Tax=Arcobacter vandammei TaxID=2782243 RepID=UPI0018DFEC58|nr:FlgO family outer membrane protein [Arcobacter vandammei]